jgi:hypothetical protein
MQGANTLASASQDIAREIAQFNRDRSDWETRNTEHQQAQLVAAERLTAAMERIAHQFPGNNMGISGPIGRSHYRVGSVEPARFEDILPADVDMAASGEQGPAEEVGGAEEVGPREEEAP